MRRGRAPVGGNLPTWYGWVIVGTIATILMATSGARFVFGVMLLPMEDEFGWSRSQLSVAVLVNMVVLSICQPVIGWVSDRFGPKRVLLTGAALVGLILIPLSFVSQLWHVYVVYGLIGGIAFAATSPVNTTVMVSRWFTRHRGAALSLATSGTPFGQLLIVPVAVYVLTQADWQSTYRLMAVLLLVVIVPLGLVLLRDRPETDVAEMGYPPGRPRAAVGSVSPRSAFRGPVFWLLAYGFVVCGFTMSFANIHFMAYAHDVGMHAGSAADVISLTAIFSVGGSLLLGWLGDRYDLGSVLGLTYALRGVSFFLLFLLPEGTLVFVYATVLGVSWSATTPLTAALAADTYGPAHLGIIFGTMFTFMNIGFGAGAFFDAVLYDLTGNYEVALLINGVAGITAAGAAFLAGALAQPTAGAMGGAKRLDPFAATERAPLPSGD